MLQHAAIGIVVRERELCLLLHPNLKNERLRPCSVPVVTMYVALRRLVNRWSISVSFNVVKTRLNLMVGASMQWCGWGWVEGVILSCCACVVSALVHQQCSQAILSSSDSNHRIIVPGLRYRQTKRENARHDRKRSDGCRVQWGADCS